MKTVDPDPARNQHAQTRLLLIDANTEDALLLREMLEGTQPRYDVTTVRSLQGALSLEDGDFDLILADLGLPDSWGLESFLKCTARWPRCPVVVLSGLANEAVAKEAVRAGAQDYLVKGDMNSRALRRALQYSIERHRVAEERRFLVRELEQSRKLEAIGQLAAGIAHEINTPTQYVSDNTRFLQDAVKDLVSVVARVRGYVARGQSVPVRELERLLEEADAAYLAEELPRAVDQSLDGLEHIARIVRAMKEFSHPANGEKVSTDLNRALDTTITVASNEWKYVADVETEYDADLPHVECLPGEMNQVFLNLLVNASHAVADRLGGHTGKKGLIKVETEAVDRNMAEVRIRDSGAGIPKACRGRLFEPFFTTKEVGRGTGQGLAIAYDVVVNKHGGRITFDTKTGHGTTFFVRLPIKAESP